MAEYSARDTALAAARPHPAGARLLLAGTGRRALPGNLGSMIRTAEALSAAGIIILDRAVDPFDPVSVRATMGAIFAQRYLRATARQLVQWKRQYRVTCAGTSPGVALDYSDAAYPRPLVVLMGAERTGLVPEHRSLCDVLVRIPMRGCVDSLNVAVATGVILYEVAGREFGDPTARPSPPLPLR